MKLVSALFGVVLLAPSAEEEETEFDSALRAGDGRMVAGDLRAARGHYEEAERLAVTDAAARSAKGLQMLREVRRRLADCCDRADKAADEEYRTRISAFFPPCAECKGTGCLPCSRCQGAGTRTEIDAFGVKREVPCPTLTIHRKCLGLGHSLTGLHSSERQLAAGIARRVEDALRESSLRKALDVIANGVRRSASRSAKYPLLPLLEVLDSRLLSQTVPSGLALVLRTVPPPAASVESASAAWNDCRTDAKKFSGASRFLLRYATAVGASLKPLRVLSGQKAPPLPVPEPAAASSAGAIPDPTEFAAMVAKAAPGSDCWQSVKGVLTECRLDAAEGKFRLVLDGGSPIQFFAWPPSSKVELERLEADGWVGAGPIASSYPFELGQTLSTEAVGREVFLVGRFLREESTYPYNWFEVWAANTGLAGEAVEAYRMLSRRIERLRLPSVPAGALTDLLEEWFGVEVVYEGVSNRTCVRGEVEGCPAGLFLDEMARSVLHCGMSWEGGKLVLRRHDDIGSPLPPDPVVQRLRQRFAGPVVSLEKVDPAAASEPQAADLPEDLAGLCLLGRRWAHDMRYREAAACYRKALSCEGIEAVQAQAVELLQQRCFLFDRLTCGVRRCPLVDAEELSEVTFRRLSEGSSSSICRVLERGENLWALELACGTILSVDAGRILGERPRETADWIESQRSRLDDLEKGLDGSSGEARVHTLIAMAQRAKNFGLAERGSEYLETALGLDALEHYIARESPEPEECRMAYLKVRGRGGE